jgi:hypothetical protein
MDPTDDLDRLVDQLELSLGDRVRAGVGLDIWLNVTVARGRRTAG